MFVENIVFVRTPFPVVTVDDDPCIGRVAINLVRVPADVGVTCDSSGRTQARCHQEPDTDRRTSDSFGWQFHSVLLLLTSSRGPTAEARVHSLPNSGTPVGKGDQSTHRLYRAGETKTLEELPGGRIDQHQTKSLVANVDGLFPYVGSTPTAR